MMDRSPLRYGYLVAVLTLAAVVTAAGGCRTVLTTAAYLIKGTNVDADYDGLKDKKVAIVCRPVTNLTYRNPSVAKELAREVGILLRENVPKIKVIDQRKVTEWADQRDSDWTEFTEVGEALEADMVVGIELQEFTIYRGQTLYQGKANVTVSIYDCTDGGQAVFEKTLPQSLYPPNIGIPTSERPEAEFRREFVRVLADQIARHFYAHDPHADITMDAAVLE